MGYCLCCNSSLLRHIRHGEVYLYCPDCRQAMPETVQGGDAAQQQTYGEVEPRPLIPLLSKG